MNREKIQALISSDTDEKIITRELIKWFITEPDLINTRYELGRTVFHLLVLHNKAQVLNALLEDTTWKLTGDVSWHEVATGTDQNGWTMFHYAAKADEHGINTMDVLLKFFPHTVDAQDINGNTPLHEAILAQRLWAVKKLVEHKCNRSLKNKNGQTALELPKINSDLRMALLAVDLSSLKSLDSRFRTNKDTLSKDSSMSSLFNLKESCPLLTTKRGSSSSASSSSSTLSLHSSLRYSNIERSESSSSNLSWEQETECTELNEIANKTAFQVFSRLIKAYQTNKRSVISASLQNQLTELLTTGLLADDFGLYLTPLLKKPENLRLIHDELDNLSPRVHELYSLIQDQTTAVITDFLTLFTDHSSIVDSAPRNPPIFDSSTQKIRTIQESLWLLTACQIKHNSERTCDLAAISHRALWLLSATPLSELIMHLNELYPHFDQYQKLIANFVIMQLIHYDAINSIKPDPDTAKQLTVLTQQNNDEVNGLGTLGTDINRHLLKTRELCSVYEKHPLLRNYYLLNQALNQPTALNMLRSFDQLVDEALAKTRSKREEEVQLIAHELRMLTFFFYQNVSIAEFYNKNWEKADICSQSGEKDHVCDVNCVTVGKSTLARHIVEFTDNFNKLSNYFVVKLLAQPPKNLKNSLQLLIEIAQALCPLNNEHYPDINHLMVINSIFNNLDISRLVNFDKELTAEDNAYRMEIETITSRDKNYRVMRHVYLQYRTTLPFLGIFRRDIIFAQDGNVNAAPMVSTEACGEILKHLLEIKLLINFERVHFHTNFPEFLKEYQCIDEENVHRASLRRKPRTSDQIHWIHTTEQFQSNLNMLINDYLPMEIIPIVVTGKKTYKPKDLPVFLVNSITSITKEFLKKQAKNQTKKHTNTEKDSLALLNLLNQLTTELPKIIRINELYYGTEQSSGMKRLETCLTKLEDLKNAITPTLTSQALEPQKEPKEKKPTKGRGSLIRSGSHIFQRHSLFKSTKDIIESPRAASSSDVSNTPEP
ncbi:RasGEF domain-containing protein [Legionella worsleiensis]|uniref:RasGEF domain protein n=1 Tax=Legionella worsleiensis TaxID=45076 RepID=A0A0W1A645_9GAMM|nr:RasGEF domain-containing protein [Legionella worsleiensis]KTD76788.1 RasGEF domain protein [Legionella worsleiensis]STY30617.1 RasGEF domain [Legionella worsleiensis]